MHEGVTTSLSGIWDTSTKVYRAQVRPRLGAQPLPGRVAEVLYTRDVTDVASQTLIHKHALSMAEIQNRMHVRAQASAHAAAEVIARALPDPFWWRHRKPMAM